MEEKGQEERQLIKIEEMNLEEAQLAEQLYNSAGLDPVVDAGLRDYDKRLHQEDKLISKVFGPRGSDIRGYGEAVAKRVASAVYALLNKQYGGKVGDLRSYLMALEEERDRANIRYDELMGRVVGILGEEYKELRTDSKEFMERFTTVLGEDLEKSKIDHEALAGKLADIDGLRSQINTLNKEMEQLKERYESQISALTNEYNEASEKLGAQIAEQNAKIETLDSEKGALSTELEQLKGSYEKLRAAIEALDSAVPYEELRNKLGEEIYAFILKDSKIPDMVIDGVGKFIDFRKYLAMAAEKGAQEASKHAETTLRKVMKK
jgi:outer membrane murein-binding lipoprotein Lpp